MLNCWKNNSRIAKMIGTGSGLVVALLLLWMACHYAVAEAAGGKVIYVNANAEGGNNGTSWEDAFTDLHTAIERADSGDQIWIAAGTYYPTGHGDGMDERTVHFRMRNGVEIYGGFAGTEDPLDFNLDYRDFVNHKTILSGDIQKDGEEKNNVYHVFYHDKLNLDKTAILDGVTIIQGRANADADPNHLGGGMFNHTSSPLLRNVVFEDNRASHTSRYGAGGGLANRNSSPTLINVTFINNYGDLGGAISNDGNSKTVLTNVKIMGNTAVHGGGISNHKSTPILTNVLITGNYASKFGGGMRNITSSPQLVNVTISGNRASESGGGIFNNESSPILRNSIVWTNGGGNITESNDSTTTIENSLVHGINNGDYGNPGTDSIFVGRVVSTNAPTTEGDYRLKFGSAAIDKGDNLFFDPSHITTDLQGNPRIFSDTIDLGAYESSFHTISVSANPPVGGSVEYHDSIDKTVKAISNAGYHFVNWTESGIPVSTEAEYVIESTGDRVLVANFALNSYDITVEADPVAGGSVDGGGAYTHGNEVTVTAVASTEYIFVNWTEGGNEVSSDAAYKFTAIENRALVANFVDQTAPDIDPKYSTTTWTKDPITITVNATDGGSGVSLVKWDEGNLDIGYFAGQGKLVSKGSFEVSSNGTYTIYAEDAAGNKAVKLIHISNINTTAPLLSHTISPDGPTYGEVTISVTAPVHGSDSGNALVNLNWMAGSHGTADFAGGANGEDILGTQKFAVSSNGTYTVYAKDAIGNEAVAEIVISTIQAASSSGGSYSPALPDVDESPVTEPTEDGRRLQVVSSMIEFETREDGTVIEVVNFDETTLGKMVEELIDSGKKVLTIRVDDKEAGVELKLPAFFIQGIVQSVDQAVINLRLNGSSYQLAIQVLNLEGIAEQWGVALEDLTFTLIIEKANDEVVQEIERLTSAQGANVISDVIDFKVIVSSGDRSIEISDFGGTYMPRSIIAGGNSAKYQTGVMYEPVTQTFSFIPSLVQLQTDGTKEAFLFAPHNSLYFVVESDGKTFTDIQGYWAQADIETLASKFIVYGVSDTEFAPESEITRAEFTALLVRSLGLSVSQNQTDSRFADVDESAWYAQVLEIAAEAGLVQGVNTDQFAPNEKITREQLAVMVYGAMKLAGAPATIGEEDDVLGKYSDHDQIAEWAKQAVAQISAAEVIQGYPDRTFAPQQLVTRAEAAAILNRFLQAVSFI